MRFRGETTESERVNKAIFENKGLSLASSGPWEGSTAGVPDWRAGGKDKILGRSVFSLTSKAADNHKCTLRGRRNQKSMLIEESYAGSKNPIERTRVRSKEMGKLNFQAAFPSSVSILDSTLASTRVSKPRRVKGWDYDTDGAVGGGTRIFLENSKTLPRGAATWAPPAGMRDLTKGRFATGKYYATSLRSTPAFPAAVATIRAAGRRQSQSAAGMRRSASSGGER